MKKLSLPGHQSDTVKFSIARDSELQNIQSSRFKASSTSGGPSLNPHDVENLKFGNPTLGAPLNDATNALCKESKKLVMVFQEFHLLEF